MKAAKTIMLGWNEKLCGVASIINTHGTRPFPQSNQWIDGVESVPHWLCYFHTFACLCSHFVCHRMEHIALAMALPRSCSFSFASNLLV